MSEEALQRIAENKRTKAKELDLSMLSLEELPVEMAELTWLEDLNLNRNPIIRPPTHRSGKSDNLFGDSPLGPLAPLTALRKLRLWETRVADISPLKGMAQLQELDLNGTQVADISPLSGMAQMQELRLSDTQVADISPLRGMAQLQELDISGTQVADISPLKGMAQLQGLDLSGTQVADISPLRGMAQLRWLLLSGTQVADISALRGMAQLKGLHLNETQVADISPLRGMAQMQWLGLSRTQVADISPLKGMAQLQRLRLNGTQVADISPLRELIAAGRPVELDRSYGNNSIFLKDCPLTNPPLEIVKQGKEAILWYLSGGEDVTVREAKVLLVGEPKSGKSSLYLRMFHPEKPLPTEGERTDCIEIHPHTIKPEGEEPFRLNIWDFGGQEILHQTHQFFFSKRAVYILLIDGSKNLGAEEHEYYREWLGWIHLLGGDSPILFFQNKVGGCGEPIELEPHQRKYPQVKAVYAANLDGVNDKHPGRAIRRGLEHYASELTLLDSRWKERHVRIRKMLEEEGKRHDLIPWAKFRKICSQLGESEESGMKHLANFFHQIGVCLHYEEDDVLRNWVILNNEWATKGVYRMVKHEPLLTETFGRFTEAHQATVWADATYRDRKEILMALMVRFEICYLLPDTKPKTWLIPQHLKKARPAAVKDPEADVLSVRYKYEYPPKGILNRLMTRMHLKVKDAGLAWRHGVVFADVGCELLATYEPKEESLSFAATGDGVQRLILLRLLTEDLERIHKEFENIQVKKWIPCCCPFCKGAPKPGYFDYEELLTYKLERGEDYKFQCPIQRDNMVEVGKPLHGFLSKTDPNGKEASWLIAERMIQEGFEDVKGEMHTIKGEFKEFRRELRDIDFYASEIPVISTKIDELREQLVEHQRRILDAIGLQAEQQSEMLELLARQNEILATEDAELHEALDDLLETIENAEMRHGKLFADFALALSKELRELWPKPTDEPLKAELKGKWKFTIPFVPGFIRYEVEAGTDYSKAFQKLIDGLGGATDRTVMRLQTKAQAVWDRSRRLLGR